MTDGTKRLRTQLAVANERIAELEERLRPGSLTERAPTTWAYEQACKVIHEKDERILTLQAQMGEVIEKAALRIEGADTAVNYLPDGMSAHELARWLAKREPPRWRRNTRSSHP